MPTLGLETHVVDRTTYDNTVRRFREQRIALPTFAQLAEPQRISPATRAALAGVDPQQPHPLNLFRVHWQNAAPPAGGGPQGFAELPEHVVLPRELTGIDSPVVVLLGDRFPMITAHKVLAAYGCLVPRVVTGQFDPTRHKAVWPSTGNYCRGGVAISRIMASRGVAVLPEGMSRERFDWLARWVADPSDIIRTPGTESNVKEIYDECARLSRDPQNIIFNQFAEFGNHLVHYACTGRALERVFEALSTQRPGLRLALFASATGSAGTIGAGDWLKDRHGTRIAAVEAVECPTLLENGFGEHNIQGIGDKHVPLIHNIMNNDLVVGVSDRATDALNVLFQSPAGREYLTHVQKVPAGVLQMLGSFGLSSICNVLACIKTARALDLGPDDVLMTVATDGAAMYASEADKLLQTRYAGGFDAAAAGAVYAQHLAGADTEHVLELTHRERTRIFNLGYYTWVEQQGVSLADFEKRRSQQFWRGLRDLLPAWDAMIEDFNGKTGVAPAG